MAKSKYYDGTKLLSTRDLNGNKPEIFMCTTNRTGGKTTWFTRYFINRFKNHGEKFALLYRYNYELDDCADKCFKDVGGLFFPDSEMESKKRASGIFHELFLDELPCGYAISLNSADQIKKYSHLFSDVERILFDEFQSETNHYCPREIQKFISIHTSIARGKGEQTRYVPVYMLSNPVSLINPYYAELGVSARLRNDTKFLRGDGWVLEQGFVESASSALKESGFNRAFANNAYIAYASQNVYLNDSAAFVERPEGKGNYICTIRYNGRDYGLREYTNKGIIYCDDNADATFRTKITVTTEDHNINYLMLRRNDIVLNTFRFFFEKGCFRFKDLQCKEAVLKALSY